MRLAAIVTQLKSGVCPSLKWSELALKAAIPAAYPAAYVFPLSEKAGADPLSGGAVRQRITSVFAIELMVKNAAAAAAGGPAEESLETTREEVKAALVGWSPGPSFAPIEYGGGALVDFEAGTAVWREEFSTYYFIGN